VPLLLLLLLLLLQMRVRIFSGETCALQLRS